ncbi:MAG: hypothetical protein ACFFD2_03830 [Promethearchaeota archaeon]
MKELGLDPDEINVKGGVIAIGHPLGTTGARLTGTLMRTLHWEKKKYGCANLCVAGGQGAATIIKRESK